LLWKSAAGIAHSQALDSGEKPPEAPPADKPQEFETRPPLGANSWLNYHLPQRDSQPAVTL
jgi:hypothetical protein